MSMLSINCFIAVPSDFSITVTSGITDEPKMCRNRMMIVAWKQMKITPELGSSGDAKLQKSMGLLIASTQPVNDHI
ncbi:unnamed protein product [Nippostrongylus brasiliensis]|uniref:MSP domain-containing protein n=1 Tax=Nippostrongylus brasiliensis TaxID=27835 RepID=A0A0N4YYD4_NIPBR|nr:unnamed protein product [Nippostrongylus brasiliensis]